MWSCCSSWSGARRRIRQRAVPTDHAVTQRSPTATWTGSISGEPGTCIAVSCTPDATHSCVGDSALVCNATGDGYVESPCSFGCADTPAPHCKYLEPKYLPEVCDSPATPLDLIVSSSGTLDPQLDLSCTGGVVNQPGAPGICVVRYRSITLAADTTLTVSGSTGFDGRPIAFVADEDINIDGTLDVSGHPGINGPGGGIFESGAFPKVDGPTSTTYGGGGAGGATVGGNGGTAIMSTGGADGGALNGGATAMNPALLAAFVGGASTARNNDDTVPYFGGGGGGLILISCRGSVNVNTAGVINAGGGGGIAGFFLLIPFSSFGGGAGGNVVIEGTAVTITGQVFANGGGGGQGYNGSTLGSHGDDGPASDAIPARGGNLIGAGGIGGDGGIIGAILPGSGHHPTTTNSTPGAGGGSVGFLQTYTPDGVVPDLSPSHVSPAFEPNGTIGTR